MHTNKQSIKVLLFGSLTDAVGKNQMELTEIIDTEQLKNVLTEKYPALKRFRFQIAVNKKIATTNQKLNHNDEVALLPPFAGG